MEDTRVVLSQNGQRLGKSIFSQANHKPRVRRGRGKRSVWDRMT
jgi:hypothetical protein